ncbi:MAG: hypothetical protein ACR5LD_06910 [Symbiopectobacterium sp.]
MNLSTSNRVTVHIVYLPVPDNVALEFALLLRNLPSDVTTHNPNAA